MSEIEPRLKRIWSMTHDDFKGVIEGVKHIMIIRNGATCLVPLSELSESEIIAFLQLDEKF